MRTHHSVTGDHCSIMAHHVIRAVFILFVTSTHFKSHSAIHLEIDPANYDPISSTTVIFRCGTDSSDTHIKRVDVIEIFEKDSKLLASVSQTATHYAPDVANKFQVDGQIGPTAGESFLRLTLLNPKVEDSGVYTCVMYYEDSSSLEKAETNQTLTINTMVGEIEILQTRIQSLQKKIATKDTATVDRVSHLQKQIETHSTRIDELNSAGNVMTAFSASLSQKISVNTGRTIVFDRIIMQRGQAYNDRTGVFTAPWGGLYFFYLALGTRKAALGNYVHMMVNKKKSIAYMETGHPKWWDDTSVNAVVKLNKGDTVRVVMSTSSGPLRANKISIFGGYCVKAN